MTRDAKGQDNGNAGPKHDQRPKYNDEQPDKWVKTPYWTGEVDAGFEAWLETIDLSNPWSIVSDWVDRGLGVSVKRHAEGQFVCTVSDAARKSRGEPFLLSGWSDNLSEAVFIIHYKIRVLLDGDLANSDKAETAKPRRH